MSTVHGVNERELRGKAIYEKSETEIKRLGTHWYKVNSQSGNGSYYVKRNDQGWNCQCPDHTFRNVKCKHIFAVEFSQKLRLEVEKQVVIAPVVSSQCPRCQSNEIVKSGLLHNKYQDLQRYECKNCHKRFVVNLGFEKMHASPQAITEALQLYFTGESLRNVQKFLALQGVNISHVAVLKWIRKYIALMDKYLEQIKPQLSETWRADELYVKIKGNQKYMFALMDDQTRYWIAQQITDSKGTSDVRPLFKNGRIVAGKKPEEIITDGARNFRDAIHKEYWTMSADLRPVHIRDIRLDGKTHNNKMERMNGEVRDREKVMRGLKVEDSAILKGYQIFHNFVRKHESLNGSTPAEASGIKVEGSNKWITLIQNASKLQSVNKEKN